MLRGTDRGRRDGRLLLARGVVRPQRSHRQRSQPTEIARALGALIDELAQRAPLGWTVLRVKIRRDALDRGNRFFGEMTFCEIPKRGNR